MLSLLTIPTITHKVIFFPLPLFPSYFWTSYEFISALLQAAGLYDWHYHKMLSFAKSGLWL